MQARRLTLVNQECGNEKQYSSLHWHDGTILWHPIKISTELSLKMPHNEKWSTFRGWFKKSACTLADSKERSPSCSSVPGNCYAPGLRWRGQYQVVRWEDTANRLRFIVIFIPSRIVIHVIIIISRANQSIYYNINCSMVMLLTT